MMHSELTWQCTACGVHLVTVFLALQLMEAHARATKVQLKVPATPPGANASPEDASDGNEGQSLHTHSVLGCMSCSLVRLHVLPLSHYQIAQGSTMQLACCPSQMQHNCEFKTTFDGVWCMLRC